MVSVSRTNVDIDDRLIAKVMELYQLPTKREAVDFALRKLIGTPKTLDEILAMEGTGWHGEFDLVRNADEALPPGVEDWARTEEDDTRAA